MEPSLIYCSEQLRDRWPMPLAREWAECYPQLFDEDDARLALAQPQQHFFEWFAAVHLFHRDGVYALLEKYAFHTHPRKLGILAELMSEQQRAFLRSLHDHHHVQPPDLLLYAPDRSAYWFAEVKGPTDSVRDAQWLSHERIRGELGVRVEIVEVEVR